MANKNAKTTKKAPVNTNFTAKLALYRDTSDEVFNEIVDVLKKTRFNRISFPLNSYRKLFDPSLPADDARLLTVGYIKKFDAEKMEFTVAVFPKSREVVEGFGTSVIEVVWNEKDNKLTTITKLNIVPDDGTEACVE